MEELRPQREALSLASASARERANALVTAEARVGELRVSLAASESQQRVMTAEMSDLRRQVLELQTECEKYATKVAELADDTDRARYEKGSRV